MRLMVVEDDEEVIGLLQRALGRSGHAVDVTTNGEDAIWMATEVSFDAILLDVNVPPPDGFEVCRRLRAAEVWASVIFLTGRDEVSDRVTGLDAGGDDYLVKPFSLAELDARLRAVGRRGRAARPTVLSVGDLAIDPGEKRVRRSGVDVCLSPKEFQLLETLAQHPGEVVTRGSLYELLWDFAFEARSNVVDALVTRLRAKIDRPFGRASVETVRGFGYRLVADA
ncbi:MAG: response regulator transcription factor [Acidimicrobiales bacterium]